MLVFIITKFPSGAWVIVLRILEATAIQQVCVPAMRGRVAATIGVATGAVLPVGSLGKLRLPEMSGVPDWIWFVALGLIAVVALALVLDAALLLAGRLATPWRRAESRRT